MNETQSKAFEPSRYLVKLKGKEYLEVKWRLVWFRDQYPQGCITTRLVEHERTFTTNSQGLKVLDNQSYATVQAAVYAGPGETSLLATGYGTEHQGDFGDYLEKAETKAIGRALAAAGFGTQFADDHEFGADEGKVVDAPVQAPAARPFKPSGW